MAIFKKGQAILALKTAKFDLGNDTYINLRELSAPEFIAFQSSQGDTETKNIDFIFDLIAKCAVDDDGKPIFSDVQDAKENLNVGLSQLLEIQKAILSISGIDAPKN